MLLISGHENAQPLPWSDACSQLATFSRDQQIPAKPPRRPTLGFTTGPLPDEIHSIVRLTWYRAGRPVEVDQFQIDECEEADHIFHYTVGQCLRQGADVCVLTAYSAEQLGVPTT